MKRRIALLAGAAVLATVGMFAPASPASASAQGVCAGQGTANLSTGLGLPGVHPANTATFNITFGVCVNVPNNKTTLTATGTVTGWCGLSYGQGVTQDGHRFTFTSQGTVLVVTGEVTGVVIVEPAPGTTGSCLNKTANVFLVTGLGVKTHAPVVTPDDRVLDDVCAATTTLC